MSKIRFILPILLLLSVACALPGLSGGGFSLFGSPTPAQTPTVTPTPNPTPPPPPHPPGGGGNPPPVEVLVEK